MTSLRVTKRDGRFEDFNPEKVHKVILWAIEGIDGVSQTDIEFAARQYWIDKVPTAEIQRQLIKSAGDMINRAPGYQWVASRLLNWSLRDQVWGGQKPPRLFDLITANVEAGKYTRELLQAYAAEEINALGCLIDHERDLLHDYAGMTWLTEKYLVQDRATRRTYETPQFAYMAFAMVMMAAEAPEKRLEFVKDLYDAVSLHLIQLSTPPLAGGRTPVKQFASCTLIDVDDTLDSIGASVQAMMRYGAQRAGLGINVGRIRPVGSRVGHGEIVHTGVVPFLKTFESAIKSVTQGGIRSASATTFFPWWHGEVETMLVLKNPTKNAADRAVFKLDYCIQFDDLFWDRLAEGGDVCLFNGFAAPGLYDAFGTPAFRDLYLKYEASGTGVIKRLKASAIFDLFISEAVEVGRVYLMNIDEVNRHSSFKQPIRMSNLCMEITQPTVPIQHPDDPDGEIGICLLSAINWCNVDVTDPVALLKVCRTIVRFLDNLIDYQDYPVLGGKTFCRKRRSLAIGITGLATWLAERGLSYDDRNSANVVAEAMELVQFSLTQASMELSQERGPCEGFSETRYADGILPIDTYNKAIDQVITAPLKCDWEGLREKIKQFGLRHSTLTAQPPCESSSVVQRTSNGIEPCRKTIGMKKSRDGLVWQVMRGHGELKYDRAFHRKSNVGYLLIVAAIQKFMDMSISANLYYAYEQFEDGKLPLSTLANDVLLLRKLGGKTLYYTNTDDGDQQSSIESSGCDGACAI